MKFFMVRSLFEDLLYFMIIILIHVAAKAILLCTSETLKRACDN